VAGLDAAGVVVVDEEQAGIINAPMMMKAIRITRYFFIVPPLLFT
jgi:hypothetical protein